MIDLRKDDPNAVHCMIQCFYTLMYPNDADIDDSARTTAVSENTLNSLPSGNDIRLAKQEVVDNSGRANTSHHTEVENALEGEEKFAGKH